jgi:hypothetical protein
MGEPARSRPQALSQALQKRPAALAVLTDPKPRRRQQRETDARQ